MNCDLEFTLLKMCAWHEESLVSGEPSLDKAVTEQGSHRRRQSDIAEEVTSRFCSLRSVIAVPDFASAAECGLLIAAGDAAEAAGVQNPLTSNATRLRIEVMGRALSSGALVAPLDGPTQSLVNMLIRRCIVLVQTELPSLAAALGLAECTSSTKLAFSQGEPAINVYYGPGGVFLPHKDMQALTLFIPLSTNGIDYEGGGTAFWPPEAELPAARSGKAPPTAMLRPCAGTALLWGGDLIHSAAEVTSGRRLVFVASFTPKGATVEATPCHSARPAVPAAAPARLPITSCSVESQQRLLSALGASAGVADVLRVPRYLRLRNGLDASTLNAELARLGYPPSQATALDDFVAVECDVAVTSLSCHGPRLAVGMDLASGVVVRELLRGIAIREERGSSTARRHVHVLDLCCAPGGKLLCAAEQCASVTGIDIANDRLDSVRAHVRRLNLPHVRLKCADATTFIPAPPPADQPSTLTLAHTPPDSAAARPGARPRGASPALHPSCWKARLLMHAEERARRAEARGDPSEAKALHNLRVVGGGEGLWERVLLDAECTADAALPHLRRMLALQATRPEAELLAYRRFRGSAKFGEQGSSAVDQTVSLQKALIGSGFSALRPGGVMLYVTCSSDTAQGEDVVAWLLGREESAKLERVDTHGVPARRVGPGGEMARFTPAESNTSGLFVCRIVRTA